MVISLTRLKWLVSVMERAVPKKTTLPVLHNLLFQDGRVYACDIETTVIARLKESAGASGLVPYRRLADTLKYIPGPTVAVDWPTPQSVKLSWEGGGATFPVEGQPADFPTLNESAPRLATGVIPAAPLIETAKELLRYAASTKDRAILHGIALELGPIIKLAAADGFRLAYKDIPYSYPLEREIILPMESAIILADVFSKLPVKGAAGDSLVDLLMAKQMAELTLLDQSPVRVRLDLGEAEVIMNTVAGSYPQYASLIPTGEPGLQVQMFAPYLEAAIRRARTVSKVGSGAIHLEFADGKAKVSATAAEEGAIESEFEAVITRGESGRMAFQDGYLLGYLNGKGGIVTISQFDPEGGHRFEYQDGPYVLLMPMFVQWGDEPPAAAAEPPQSASGNVEPDSSDALPQGAAAGDPDERDEKYTDDPTGEPEQEEDGEAGKEDPRAPESLGDDGGIAVAAEPAP